MTVAGTDAWASAPTIGFGVDSLTTTATSFTVGAGEPLEDDEYNYRTAWWKLLPSENGFVDLSTVLSSSGADTAFWVYKQTGATIADLVLVAEADANVEDDADDRASAVNIGLVGGETYYVAVGDYDEPAAVTYRLSVSALTANDVVELPPEGDPAYTLGKVPIGDPQPAEVLSYHSHMGASGAGLVLLQTSTGTSPSSGFAVARINQDRTVEWGADLPHSHAGLGALAKWVGDYSFIIAIGTTLGTLYGGTVGAEVYLFNVDETTLDVTLADSATISATRNADFGSCTYNKFRNEALWYRQGASPAYSVVSVSESALGSFTPATPGDALTLADNCSSPYPLSSGAYWAVRAGEADANQPLILTPPTSTNAGDDLPTGIGSYVQIDVGEENVLATKNARATMSDGGSVSDASFLDHYMGLLGLGSGYVHAGEGNAGLLAAQEDWQALLTHTASGGQGEAVVLVDDPYDPSTARFGWVGGPGSSESQNGVFRLDDGTPISIGYVDGDGYQFFAWDTLTPGLTCFVPSEYTWGNNGEPAEHADLGTGATGTDVLTPGNDASYASAWAVDNNDFDYLIFRYMNDVPVGEVLTEADVSPNVRVSVGDDGDTPGDHRLQIRMYDRDPAGQFYCSWQYALPADGTVYNLDLPLDEYLEYDDDHWVTFLNETPGAADQEDPWETIAGLMRTGSLVVRVQRSINTGLGRPWTEGHVTVHTFALCMPEAEAGAEPSAAVPIWMQSGVYDAGQERVLTGLMFDKAIAKGSDGNAFVATGQGGVVGHLGSLKPSVTGSDMNFTIQPGVVMVPRMGPPFGAYICHNQGPFTGTIDPELSANPRIDLLVAGVDASGEWAFTVIAGTPAVNPLTPTPGAEQVAIASFRIIPAALNGGADKINGSGLVDLRSFQSSQGGVHIVGNGATQPTFGPGRLVYDYSTRSLQNASTPFPTFQGWRDYVAPFRAKSAYDTATRVTRGNTWSPNIQYYDYNAATAFVNGSGSAFGPAAPPVVVTGVSSPIGAFKVTIGAHFKVPYASNPAYLECRAMIGYSAVQPGFSGNIPVSDAWSAAGRIAGYPTWTRHHVTFIAEGFVTNSPVDFTMHFRCDVSGCFVFYNATLLLVEPFL